MQRGIKPRIIERRERERNRMTEKERGKERRKGIERIEGKRNKELKEICSALCDYHLVSLKYDRPALL